MQLHNPNFKGIEFTTFDKRWTFSRRTFNKIAKEQILESNKNIKTLEDVEQSINNRKSLK